MINVAYFTALILVFFRLIGFFTITPVFFPKGTPSIFKIGFGMVLAYMLIPGIDYQSVNTINSMFPFIIECVSEVITGLTLGAITEMCFTTVRIAGNMMDMQVGLSMLSMFDPNSNSNTTLLERLLYWISLILFLIIDGHHMLISSLVQSFDIVKIGNFILNEQSITLIIKAFIEFFYIALKIAIPIVLIIIITDITLGLVARTVPQLNVMILGLPIKILIGLSAFALALPAFLKLIESSFVYLPDIFKNIFKTVPLIIIFASDDKTEEATPHKLSEAKKKGQTVKSKELNQALTLLASTIILITLGEYVIDNLGLTVNNFLTNYLNTNLTYNSVKNITVVSITRIGLIVLPVVTPIMIMGILANFLQTGYIFTTETLKPDLKKLNPISGLKKIFSMRSVVQLFKDLAMISVVGYVGYLFLKDNYSLVMSMSNLKFRAIIESFGKLITSVFFRVTMIMLMISIADFMYQKWQFKKDMRMSKQEVKEEFKQQEGDPQIKGKIKQKQREMAMGRMMQQVPDATVVVTNPTHIAVALKYEEGADSAPKLVAKGTDFLAIKIKEKAKESEIPIIENKPLARLIYEKVDLDSEIPVDMYNAVAEILAVVFKLKKK